MSSELHRSVWLAYCHPVQSDRGESVVSRFQAAVDAVLCSLPGVDAPSACQEAARMIMMPPPGMGARRRTRPAIASVLPFPTLTASMRREAPASGRR
jgi:hypothetical protein